MAKSPLVSIRVPPETLERIDRLAQQMYPSRRAGGSPNRSQVILDAIDEFLKQRDPDYANPTNIDEEIANEEINKSLQLYRKCLELPMNEYLDWWFACFSYVNKLTNMWFGSK